MGTCLVTIQMYDAIITNSSSNKMLTIRALPGSRVYGRSHEWNICMEVWALGLWMHRKAGGSEK